MIIKTNAQFESADDDTIVVYIDGRPITKKEALSGYVKLNDYTTRRYPGMYKLPASSKNANVVKRVTAPRFSQDTTYQYLSEGGANSIARDLDFNVKKDGIWFLSGFIPKIGPIITIASFFNTWRNSDLAGQIRNYTNKHQSCIVKHVKSRYGNFIVALYWDGQYVDLSTSSSYEKVISFSHD